MLNFLKNLFKPHQPEPKVEATDIPVLENEETWSQRVIDEQVNKSEIVETVQTPSETVEKPKRQYNKKTTKNTKSSKNIK
jgi:DNA polymerase II large subunit